MKQKTEKILIVDDEPALLEICTAALSLPTRQIFPAATVAQARALLALHTFNAVLTDMRLPDGLGLEILQACHTQSLPPPCVVMTAYSSADNAVDAMKAGAFDYLVKPVNLAQLRAVVKHMVDSNTTNLNTIKTDSNISAKPETLELKNLNRKTETEQSIIDLLPGQSAVMVAARHSMVQFARSQAPVMVFGETGTGKELFARGIHACSSRHTLPFVAVNCGAIPENLMEAEFFGVKKGAYTGADRDREGFFQAAEGGTLFLDEVAELPLSMQVKLLRVIQERKVRRVGDTAELAIDIRIVSATHNDLAGMVAAGLFRQDLYYRLNVMDMTLPPLRERGDDVIAIAQAWLVREGGARLSEDATQWLKLQRFTGNVRELQNTLSRASAMCEGEAITAALLEGKQTSAAPVFIATPTVSASTLSAPAAKTNPLENAQATEAMSLPLDLAAYLASIEKIWIERALVQCKYNRTQAAGMLGMNLRQIRYRIAQLGIDA